MAPVSAWSTATGEPGGVLATCIMASVPGVAVSIARFIAAETIEGALATFGQGAAITVTRIVAIIYMAIKAAGPVKPRSNADEDAVREPIGPVVAIGCAIVRSVVEVPVRAVGLGAEIDADADTDLGWRVGAARAEDAQQTEQHNA